MAWYSLSAEKQNKTKHENIKHKRHNIRNVGKETPRTPFLSFKLKHPHGIIQNRNKSESKTKQSKTRQGKSRTYETKQNDMTRVWV